MSLRPGLSVLTRNPPVATLRSADYWRDIASELEGNVDNQRILDVLTDIQETGSSIERDPTTSTAAILKATLTRWRNSQRANKPANVPAEVKSATLGLLLTFYQGSGGKRKRTQTRRIKRRSQSRKKGPRIHA